MGNPTTYRGNSLTWSHVRRLKKYGTNTFEYGADGIRTKKNSITYTLDGNRILKETDGTKTLIYYYGNSGVIGFKYNNVDYYYEKNLQGDVIAIYNTSGTKVASYVYDAWGKVLSIKNASGTTITDSTHVGIINPFRYRSYYYDVEIGLYYLQSRYYDPEVGRFINSDSFEYLGDGAELSNYNLFAYCGNNPVKRIDINGQAWYDVLYDWANTIAGVLNPISKRTALGSLGVAAIQGRWDDIKSDWDNGCLNPFNQSEDVAGKAKVLGFYKGSTVVRQDIIGTCSIFGTIWAESGITSETLKHEFGHSVQERFMGISYSFKVAIPSAIYCWYDAKTDGSSYDYYSMPWERTADWLSGVNRSCGYKKGSLGWAIAENIIGPAVIPFYLLFGY